MYFVGLGCEEIVVEGIDLGVVVMRWLSGYIVLALGVRRRLSGFIVLGVVVRR